MIEQVSAGTTTKRRRSRLVSKQNGTQPTPSKRPTNDDKEAWKAYWKEKGQWWRMEPEIDGERQKYLADRRTITPDIQQGIYPFRVYVT